MNSITIFCWLFAVASVYGVSSDYYQYSKASEHIYVVDNIEFVEAGSCFWNDHFQNTDTVDSIEHYSQIANQNLFSSAPLTAGIHFNHRTDFFIHFLLYLTLGLFYLAVQTNSRKDIAQRIKEMRKEQRQTEHVNRLLAAIRNINQLIIQEKDRDLLLDKACALLVETHGFFNAWITLLDQDKPVVPAYHSGFNGDFSRMEKMLQDGKIPECAKQSLKMPKVHIVKDPYTHCQECPLSSNYSERAGFNVRIEHDEIFGWLCVSVPKHFAEYDNEKELLKEIANDIGFALYNIKVEEKRQQSVAELEASEKRYRTYVENAATGIFIADEKGQLVQTNPAACKMLGYSEPEYLQMTVWELLHEESFEKNKDYFDILKQQGTFNKEFMLKHKNMSKVFVEMSSVKLSQDRYMAICTDITDKRNTELALQEANIRKQEAVSAGNIGLWDWDLQTNKVIYSEEWKNQIGYSDDEIKNDFGEWQKRVHPDDLQPTLNHIQQMISEKKQQYKAEFRFRHKDGHYLWVLAQGSVITDEKNEPVRVLGSHVDITDRKQMEQDLLVSEEKHRALYENAPLSYQSLNDDGEFIDINPAWLQTLGFHREQVVGHHFSEFLHPDFVAHFNKNFPQFKKRGYVHNVHFKMKHANGHYIDVLFEGCAGYHTDGRFRQTYCVFKDVTSQKIAENALQVRSQVAEAFITGEGLQVFHNVLQVILKHFSSRFGYFGYIDDNGDLLCPSMTYDIWDHCQMPVKSTVFPQKVWGGLWGQSLQERKNLIQNEGLTVPDGHIQLHNAMATVIKVQEKLLGQIVIANRDENYDQADMRLMEQICDYIAPLLQSVLKEFKYKEELVLANKKIQESEAKYKSLFNNKHAVMVLIDPSDGSIIDANPGAIEFYGYDRDKMLSLKISEINVTPGIDLNTELFKASHHKKNYFQYKHKLANGEIRDVDVISGSVIINEKKYLYSIIYDISEKVKAENDLNVTLNKMTGIFKAAPIGLGVMKNRQFVEVNERFCEMLGYSKEEILGRDARFLYTSDEEYTALGQKKYKQIQEKGIGTVEARFLRKDGQIIDVLVSSTPLDPNDPAAGFASSALDITEIKRAETALHNSQMLLDKSQELSKVGGWEWNCIDEKMYWTSETYQIHELDPNTILSGDPTLVEKSLECYAPDDRPVIKQAFENCYKNGIPYDLEFPFTTQKGNRLRIRTMAIPVIEGNQIVRINGYIMDITEKHQIQQQYQTLFDKMIDGFALHEIICNDDGKPIDYRFLEINPSFTQLTGLTRDILGYTVKEKIPETENYWIEIYGNVALTGKPVTFENYASGLDKYFKVTAYRPAKMQFACIFTDISEQKKAEKALQGIEARQRAMISNISDVIGIISKEGIVKYKSPNIQKHFGWVPEDLINTNAWLTVHPDDLDRIQTEFYELMQHENDSRNAIYRYKCKDGSYKWIELTATNMINDPDINGVLVNYNDISDRKKSEEIQQIYNIRWMQAQRIAKIGHWEYNIESGKVWGSEEAFHIYGIPFDPENNPEQKMGLDKIESCIPERERVHQALVDLITQNKRYELEYNVVRSESGEIITVFSRADVLYDSKGKPLQVVGTIQDITVRKQVEDQIQKDLKEKEVLLKEIHHRVKNNMQVIISLLNLQAEKIKDKDIAELFEDSRQRIYSMALVHEQLYKSEYLSKIEMKPYLETITRDLIYSYATNIDVVLDLQVDDVMCDINQAIPSGLIFNELITNTLKHAFHDRTRGKLIVAFYLLDNKEFKIVVKDDGVGLPVQIDIKRATSLGLKLVTVLSGQLGGDLQFDIDNGTEISIVFPAEET